MEQLRSPNELQIQADIWKTIWSDPELKEARRLLFHVPNEATYDNGQQASSGVIPGTPDLFLLWAGTCYPIELKDDQGSCSDIQKVVHSLYHRQGFITMLFDSSPPAIRFIKSIILGESVASDWSEFFSPYADGDQYEALLESYQVRKQAARERKAERGRVNGFKFKKYKK